MSGGWLKFVGCSLLAGAVGTAFIQPTLDVWYPSLARPAWLASRASDKAGRDRALRFFYAQLVLNA